MTRLLSLALAIVLVASGASAQTPRDGRLLVTVVDQTGAVIAGATVTVVGQDEANRLPAVPSVHTSDQGIAAVPALRLGRYTVQAEFPGFQVGLAKEVRVRAGDNKQTVALAIERLQDEVTVSQGAQESAADPRSRTFGSTLTREQVEALSDDPAEAQRQLQDMAGGGAILRVDSFEGGQLPPKSQIKSIHVTRDGFAAENHNAGGIFIDIITQPGVGPIRGGMNARLRDGALSARSPFAAIKPDERTQEYQAFFGGSLINQKSSFQLNLGGSAAFDTPILTAALPGGTQSYLLGLRTPRDNMYLFSQLDYALTPDQTLRIGYNRNTFTSSNLGIGAYDKLERAYSTDNRNNFFRIQEAGPIGRRFFINSRFSLNVSDTESRSDFELPTVRVNDAFTEGGQQIAGGRHLKIFNLASDLDYVRGIHSLRTGVLFDGGFLRTDDSTNYLGTYTFESLAAYQAGTPRSYTRRIGNPAVDYFNLRTNLYVQDDIRVRRSLTLSPGLRYESESKPGDFDNFGPRFGITWAPFQSGKTTFRGSTGIFYDWLNGNTYEQSLRVDGTHQQDVNILNPTFPDPGPITSALPSDKYFIGGDYHLARTFRVSAGVDQAILPKVRVGILYTYARAGGLKRGVNLNAPVGGVRPDPAFANIIEVASDAESRQHSLGFNYSLGALPPPIQSGPRIDWKRFYFSGVYTLASARSNTSGDLSTPPNGDLSTEWGPTGGDIRQRFNLSMTSQVLKNSNFGLNFNAQSAPPYTIRTGLDDNGDLVFNDRPVGVDRNSARGNGQFNLNGNFSYTFLIGKRQSQLPPGIAVRNVNGQITVQQFQLDNTRYRLTFYVNAQNITNHGNYTGFNGTMTSPLFGQATTVTGMRKIDVGMNFNF